MRFNYYLLVPNWNRFEFKGFISNFFKNLLYYLFNLNKIFIKLSRLVCQKNSGFRTLKSSTIAEILAIWTLKTLSCKICIGSIYDLMVLRSRLLALLFGELWHAWPQLTTGDSKSFWSSSYNHISTANLFLMSPI